LNCRGGNNFEARGEMLGRDARNTTLDIYPYARYSSPSVNCTSGAMTL